MTGNVRDEAGDNLEIGTRSDGIFPEGRGI